MKGNVVHINRRKAMVAVLTEDGEYSTIELLDDDEVRTTMIYTLLLNRGGNGARSLIDTI